MEIKNIVLQNKIPKRAEGLDILKCLCAFMIICIHCPFSGVFGEYFIALTRIAVPIFFIITVFFYISIVNKKRELLQIRKIVGLMIFSNLLYAFWKSLKAFASGIEVIDYWRSVINIENIIKFIFLNESPFNFHLWYLGAVLYVLIIMYFVRWLHIERILFLVTPLLLVMDLVLGKYSLLILGREFPYLIVRNFLFVGIPYFMIGKFLSMHWKEDGKWIKEIIIIGIFIFSITTLLERYLLVKTELNTTRDHYFSTTFLAIAVFLLFLIEFPHNQNNRLEITAAKIGREYSTGIYVIHPIVITILSSIMKKVGFYRLYSLIAPFAVFIVSILIMIAVISTINLLKRLMGKQEL